MTSGIRAGWAACVILGLAAAGLGQAEDPAIPLDEGEDPESLAPETVTPETVPPPAPAAATDVIPGLGGRDFALRQPPLLPEGVFLAGRRGTLVEGGNGEWWFAFHRDEKGRAEQPMVLLPSGTLERMTEVAAREGERPVFRITGQVFVYSGRNYLLPTLASRVTGAEIAEAAPAPAAVDAPAAGAGEPTVDELIRELSAVGTQPRALSPAAQVGAAPASAGHGSAPPTGGARLMPEGKFIARRQGRLVRDQAAWAFAFDNDSDAAAAEEPLILIPGLTLEAMERAAALDGEAVKFELSGRVLEFRGRNYVAPTMFRIVSTGELRPMR